MELHTLAKNQIVVEEQRPDGTTKKTFFSYDTEIASTISCPLKYTELSLNGNMWDFSNTTRKWFKKFINDFTCFEYDSKENFILEVIETSPHVIVY